MFYENGPFKINKNMSLAWNEYGWDQVSNLMYVDQPVGTGFSYTTTKVISVMTRRELAMIYMIFCRLSLMVVKIRA
ncbi:hypothetical protein Bca52824_026928 [Brassica carinata]|uniref:Uncharacterized protein n=1 Tax=Brassica carinata TaxID=52824 RepID=A0A8X7SK90_BRACI|nr:hypothetical protein Bca52824_026928 [Brassica carinata]